MAARLVVSLSGRDWMLGEGAAPAAWIHARVPGNVQEDLWRAGLKPDPYFGTNADAYRDTEIRTWTYRLRFDPDPFDSRATWTLQFDGVDYRADFHLNGHSLGSHEGMYGDACFPVTGLLRRKGNELRVAIHPLTLAPRESRAVIDPLAPQRHDGRWMVKSLMSFFWDFAPRLVPTGIWKDVRLIGTRGARLHGPRTDCVLSGNQGSAELSFTACVSSEARQDVEAVLELYENVGSAGRGSDSDSGAGPTPALTCRRSCTLPAGEAEIVLSGRLARPRLWWPSGMGEPYLYTARLRLEKQRRVLDTIEFSVGVRTIAMIRTPKDQAEEVRIPASSLKNETTLVVNGTPIAYRGINVAPMDVLYGRIDDARIAEQMRLARDANLNLLRVWGGGIVPRDLFYDLADRSGIMLWQEFPMGCTDHEGNPHFREVLLAEAQSMVRALRCHPSLALWGGGNELFMPHSGMGPQDRLVRMLGSVCYTLDPERIFLPSTPYPGAFHGPYTFDCFGQGGFGSSVDHVRFCNMAPDGAYNECGVAGPARASLVRKHAPPEEWWPPRRGGTWEFHKAFGAWGDGNTWLLPELIERYFGGIDRLEDLCRAGQFLQAIGLQYLLEEMRRKWPNVPGTMPWCFNTPWTSFAGSFVVQYPDTPLPAYHALASAYAPRNVSARLQGFLARPGQEAAIELFVLNDSGSPVGPGTVTVAIGPLGAAAWVERRLAAPAVPTMGRAALGRVSVDIPPEFRGVVAVSLCWQHQGGEERNRAWLGVAPGDAPSACFRPLLSIWDRDPSARLPGME